MVIPISAYLAVVGSIPTSHLTSLRKYWLSYKKVHFPVDLLMTSVEWRATILTYFVRGSITAQLTTCFLYSAALFMLNEQQFNSLSQIQTCQTGDQPYIHTSTNGKCSLLDLIVAEYQCDQIWRFIGLWATF